MKALESTVRCRLRGAVKQTLSYILTIDEIRLMTHFMSESV